MPRSSAGLPRPRRQVALQRVHVIDFDDQRELKVLRHQLLVAGQAVLDPASQAQAPDFGNVRRRLLALFDTGLDLALRAADAEAPRGAGVGVTTALTARFRTLVLEGPDGETRAAALAKQAGAHISAGNLDTLQALLTPPTIALTNSYPVPGSAGSSLTSACPY